MDTDHTPNTNTTDHADTGKVNIDTGGITMADNDTRTIADTAFRVTQIGHYEHVTPGGLKFRLCNGVDIGTGRADLLVGIPEVEAWRIIEAWDGAHIRPRGFNYIGDSETDGAR